MESALPFGCECEGLRQSLTDDVAGFVRLKQNRVKRRDLYHQTVDGSFEFRIEGFKMIVDGLNGFLHFFRAVAADGDLDVMFWFHILLYFLVNLILVGLMTDVGYYPTQ